MVIESFKASTDFGQEMVKAVDSFKMSEEYHDAMVAFGQASFNEGHGV